MGEAKTRGVDTGGYGEGRAYATIGRRAWFIGVSSGVKRECMPGGGGAIVTHLVEERAAMLGCPNAVGPCHVAGPPADEETKMAVARAIASAN